MSQIRDTFLLAFLILISINFFSPVFLPDYVKVIRYGIILIFALFSLKFMVLSKDYFAVSFRVIVAGIFLSILSCYIFWKQPIITSFISTLPFFVWTYYFGFRQLQFSVRTVENSVLICGVFYIAIFAFQFLNQDSVYFGLQEELDESRGVGRVLLPGAGVFIFSLIISLKRFTLWNKYRLVWGLFICLGLVIPFLQATRQLIFAIVLIFLYHFFSSGRRFVLFGFAICLFIIIAWQSENTIVKGLKDVQNSTLDSGSEYIRVKAAQYFLFELPPTPLAAIFGNGVPSHPGRSRYGDFVHSLSVIDGLYLSDIGLVSFFCMFGAIGLLGYVLLGFKAFSINLGSENNYLKYYLAFLLFTCLTSDTVYSSSFLITTVLVFYSIYKVDEVRRFERIRNFAYQAPEIK